MKIRIILLVITFTLILTLFGCVKEIPSIPPSGNETTWYYRDNSLVGQKVHLRIGMTLINNKGELLTIDSKEILTIVSFAVTTDYPIVNTDTLVLRRDNLDELYGVPFELIADN